MPTNKRDTNMYKGLILWMAGTGLFLAQPGALADFHTVNPVRINAETLGVTVRMPGGREVQIRRNQDTSATIDPEFALTSRPCPPSVGRE